MPNIQPPTDFSKAQEWKRFLEESAYRGYKINRLSEKLEKGEIGVIKYIKDRSLIQASSTKKGASTGTIFVDQIKKRFSFARWNHERKMKNVKSSYAQAFHARIEKLAAKLSEESLSKDKTSPGKKTEAFEAKLKAPILPTEPPQAPIPPTQSLLPSESDFVQFKNSRRPKVFPDDRECYTKATTGKVYRLDDKSQYNEDQKVALRSDSKPLEKESIEDYLSRIYNAYECDQAKARGLVFAGHDFLVKSEGEHPALTFLNQYIDLLKELKVKKVFLEQLFGFNSICDDQERNIPYLLHQYFLGQNDLPEKLTEDIKKICRKCKESGIEVIGTEVQTKDYSTQGSSNEARLRNYNMFASSFIQTINEPFVVFVGAAHGKLRRYLVPGLSEYLDCPCIGLVSGNFCKFVEPGTHRFTEGEYSVDAVISE